MEQPRLAPPSLPLALVPVVLTLALLALQLFYFGDFTPHIPLVIGLAITGLVGVLRGQKWLDIREASSTSSMSRCRRSPC